MASSVGCRCCAFSHPIGNFATTSADGRLSVWETETGVKKQSYTPSFHLSSTCTRMAWQRKVRRKENQKKKKKRKSVVEERPSSEREDLAPTDLLALGTVAGSVLLYSYLSGDLHSKLDGGHDDVVNDVAWHPSENVLFSCSDDGNIVEWDVSNKTIKSKWKGDKTSVHSLCVCPGGQALLSAGRTIQLWNLSTKTVIKKFTGHANSVTRLRTISLSSQGSDSSDQTNSVDGLYFLSSAVNDRIVNVWQVKLNSKDKTSIASLAVPDEPLDFDICTLGNSVVFSSVTTVTGQVHLFETVLNGRSKKPFQPKHTITISTEGSKQDPARPIPILCAKPSFRENTPVVWLAYGPNIKPSFESVTVSSTQKEICLIREEPFRCKREAEESGIKVKKPLTSNDATVLGPSNMAPNRPMDILAEPTKAERRKAKRKSLRTELSMEDRVNALSIAQAKPDVDRSQPPRADVMVTLLTQGLQSQDNELLDRVLKQDRAKVITNTIQRLPVPLIVPLVQELAKRMNTAPQSGLVIAHWTKEVLKQRASYLMTCPELMIRLSNMYETINTRTSSSGRLSRLHSKLDLMLAQVSSQDEALEVSHTDPAMLVYEDESSDELDLLDDGLAPHSESEGEWEEFSESDMEQEQQEKIGGHSDSESDMSAKDEDDDLDEDNDDDDEDIDDEDIDDQSDDDDEDDEDT